MLMFAVAFAASALVCYLIVRSVRWHLPFTGDLPGVQPQKFHTHSVPRVGGVGVLSGMAAAGVFLVGDPRSVEIYWILMLCLMPAFLGGLVEDVTRRVGPGTRLLLTIITAAGAYSLAGVHFVNSDMLWLNYLLSYAPFGYLALLLAVAGVAHSLNLIDGYNGLASGVAAIMLGAMGFVAQQSNDDLVTAICYGTAAATVGFLIFNYPKGRIFLGDSGAYLLGCVIALAGAMLILRNREVSPWFPLALVIYPVWETLFSILRRALIYGTSISHPDAKHMHSLVYRRISRRWARGRRAGDKAWRNSMTSIPFWLANAVLAVFAVAYCTDTRAQQAIAVIFVGGYCLVYWRMSRLAGPVQRKIVKKLRRPRRAAAPGVRRAGDVTDDNTVPPRKPA